VALEDILRSLDEKAQDQIRSVRAGAEERVREITSEIEREAARTRRMTMRKTEDRVRSEANAVVYSAQLQAKGELIKAQEEAVDETFRIAEERLTDQRSADGYRAILEALLDECIEYIDGEMVVWARSDDRQLVEELMRDRDVPYTISDEGLEVSGGLVASSADGGITVFNTFESRLEKARDKLKLEIADALFGGQAVTDT
jgi:V/A-type H+/Na+-transporting ATPase subunit E